MLITVCMLDYYTFAGLLYGVSDIVGWKAPSYPRSSPGAAIRQDTSREACQKIYVLVASALPVSYFVPKDVLHIAWCKFSDYYDTAASGHGHGKKTRFPKTYINMIVESHNRRHPFTTY